MDHALEIPQIHCQVTIYFKERFGRTSNEHSKKQKQKPSVYVFIKQENKLFHNYAKHSLFAWQGSFSGDDPQARRRRNHNMVE